MYRARFFGEVWAYPPTGAWQREGWGKICFPVENVPAIEGRWEDVRIADPNGQPLRVGSVFFGSGMVSMGLSILVGIQPEMVGL